jgi:hypothetical protein
VTSHPKHSKLGLVPCSLGSENVNASVGFLLYFGRVAAKSAFVQVEDGGWWVGGQAERDFFWRAFIDFR